VEVLVQFPVYRTYIDRDGINEGDRICIEDVIAKAKTKLPKLINEFNFIEKILLLEEAESLKEEDKALWLHFVMRLQQFTGPLMAKGVEDTALYVYNRLLSLNEVGGTPGLFGISVSVFHNFNQKSQDRWPHAMNASSTHDTKRSEDVRARINVLSEIPDEWETQVKTWSELNRTYKKDLNGRAIPDANDEYFLYQTLVGAFPFTEDEYPQFVDRIKDYVIKAVREAKVHTAWLRPDSDYEDGFVSFVEQILQQSEENQFLAKLRSFQEWIAYYGMFNSLSQTLLKMAAPGVPDFYQGTELWDLSLVDPDNRRPVDFERRWSYLQDIKERVKTDISGTIADLLTNKQDGRIKLFLITKVLEARNKNLDLFQQGAYISLDVVGKYQDHIVAFARRDRQNTAIAIAPRFLTSLVEPDAFPLGEKVWADTRITIPQGLRANWKDAFTAQEIPDSDTIAIAQALQHFPVALLVSNDRE
jgi:(1->4)-alpha-D-glucan 1-alpha-D-glucosylmutase